MNERFATMVMNWTDYSDKLTNLIGDGSYTKVKEDTHLKTERMLSYIFNKYNVHLIITLVYR